jgi:hypothetical protein
LNINKYPDLGNVWKYAAYCVQIKIFYFDNISAMKMMTMMMMTIRIVPSLPFPSRSILRPQLWRFMCPVFDLQRKTNPNGLLPPFFYLWLRSRVGTGEGE